MKLSRNTPTDMTDIPDLTGTDDQGNNCALWNIVDIYSCRIVFTNLEHGEAIDLWNSMVESSRYVVETK